MRSGFSAPVSFLRLLAVLGVLGILTAPAISAQAGDCGTSYTCSDVTNWWYPATNPNVSYPQNPLYGSFTSARDFYSWANCDGFVTKSSVTDTWDNKATKQPNTQCTTKQFTSNDINGNVQYNSSAPQAIQQIHGGSAATDNQGAANGYYNNALVDDTLWFTSPGASAGNPKEVPFRLCFKYGTTPGPNPYNTYGDAEVSTQLTKFAYLGTLAQINSSWTSGTNTINRGAAPNWTTDKCNTGKWTLTGPGGGAYSRLTLNTIGTRYYYAPPIHQYRRNGKVDGNFQITGMPAGVTCNSASGVFPGCDFPADPLETPGEDRKKEPDNSCNTTANPINFAYGFKLQTENDYTGPSLLQFTRIYRSNGDWLNFNLGKYWRHNYDRTITLVTGPQSKAVEITTAEGTAYKFRSDVAVNNWQALDSDVKATFTELYDATPTLIGYLYTDENKTKETYNTSRKLTRIETQGGEALNLTYDGSGRLSTVTDEHGRSLTLTYDGSSRVSTVVTPDGTFTYTYGTNNNLTQVTKPDTKTRIYHYENTTFVNALTGITDEMGVRYATWGYDAQGRANSSSHAGGVDDYTLTYNADGTITETNPLGKQTIYTTTVINGLRKITKVDGVASAHCPAANMAYTYNSSGYLASTTDWEGNLSNYTTDANGLETARVEAVGTAEERTITTTWDTSLRLPDVITEAGKTTDYAYDSFGRMTSVTVKDTATNETRTTTYTYWSNTTGPGGQTILGRLKEIDGPRTDVTDKTTFTYDASFRLIKTTNALGQFTETTSFDAADRPLIAKDENGIETRMTYDALGRLKTVKRAFGTALEALTTFTYNFNGDLTQIDSPNGATVTYTYDTARRLTGMADDLGNTVTYTLDDAGNILTETRKDPANVLKYTHSQTFDEMSRLLTSVGAGAGWTRSYAYDKNSNQTTYTNANNHATNFAFDGLDRLVTATDALSGVTTNTINDLDQTTGIKDPRNNSTTYAYNAFGDVTQIVSPDTGTTMFVVNKAGSMTQRADARGVVTNYTYDALNRLATVAYPSDTTLNITLTWDDNPTPGNCGTSIGRLCRVVDAAGTTDYKYNALGQLIEVKEVRGALTFTTAYEYDLAGVLKKITLPSGRQVTYTLNGNGQVTNVSAPVNGTATTLASSIAYLPYGPMTGLTYGNSKTLSATYDQDYRPTNRTVSGVFNHAYDTDNDGNITQKGVRTYTYDVLERLNAEAGGTATSFTYDPIGNRLTETYGTLTSNYAYPSTSSKLTSVNTSNYSYDAMGNVINDTVFDYSWNAAGLLKQTKVAGTSVVAGTYTSNFNKQRSKKVTSLNTYNYIYGLDGLLYGEYDNSGNLIREYVWLHGEPLAQIDKSGGTETVTYLHTDHLATPRYGTNTAGSTVWTWDSGAFGREVPTATAVINLRFPGHYYDEETGRHYNWNRYYNPATGRYISSDPIGLAGGLATYNYVSASPVMFSDPEGLFDDSPWPQPQTETETDLPRSIANAIPKVLRYCRLAGGVIVMVIMPVNETCATAPEKFGPRECGAGFDCKDIYKEIEEALNEIRDRYMQMFRDPLNLYNRRRLLSDRTSRREGTWEGHQIGFNNTKRRIKKWVDLAEHYGCKDYNKEALEWLKKSAPEKPMIERIKDIGSQKSKQEE
ncbi:MAG: RHS repeat protein [Alphaproteobacteria bacterium]|nr:RHS repeat protein [Alphaproteobacteria bacterium]QQS56960.1 MAG: RHS repeat protein [Alphaproteobacteria bacterium]